jgi:hypothetical protein
MTLSEDDELVGDDNSSDEHEDEKFRPLASMNYNDKAVSGHGELHARRRYYQQRLYSSPMRHDFSGGLNNNGELQPSNMYISDQLTGTSGIGTVEMGRGGQSGGNNQPSKQTQMHLPPEIMNSLKNKKANPQTGIRETRRVSLFLKSGVAPDSIEMIQSKKIAEANKMVDAGQGHVVGHRVMPNLSMTSKEDLAIQSFSKTRIGKKSTSKTTSAEQSLANNTPLPPRNTHHQRMSTRPLYLPQDAKIGIGVRDLSNINVRDNDKEDLDDEEREEMEDTFN